MPALLRVTPPPSLQLVLPPLPLARTRCTICVSPPQSVTPPPSPSLQLVPLVPLVCTRCS